MLNTSAIASGYAGRDPQGGFAMEALRFFVEIVKKISESSSLFYVMKKKKKVNVKVKKKAKDEEGGKSENDEKRLCTMKWRRMKTNWEKWLVI